MRKISLLALLAVFSLSLGAIAGDEAAAPAADAKVETGANEKHEEKVVKKVKAKAKAKKAAAETENTQKPVEEAPKN